MQLRNIFLNCWKSENGFLKHSPIGALAANLPSMHKPFFIFIAFCLTTIAKGQIDIKTFVKENAISIATIQPDSTNYEDLIEIGKAIGDSKIVMLGEQDHGDAPTFLAKTRLIKYLHEKKGFNVLAFESDFFGLNIGWDNLPKNESAIDTFLRKNIFPIWTYCDACQDLFYTTIPNSYKTGNPITISGFDNQLYLRYSSLKLSSKFDSVIKKLSLPISLTADYSTTILPLIDSISRVSIINKDTIFYNLLLDKFKIIKSELITKVDANNFWILVLDNFISLTIELKFYKSDYYKSRNSRDVQMAKNLKWLSNIKFPNEKIIVWAHNYHISKYGGNFTPKFLNQAITMGTEFTKDSILLKSTYILGFTSNTGSAGRLTMDNKTYKVQKSVKNGFENWIPSDFNYSFIDFKNYNNFHPNNAEEFNMKASLTGGHRNLSAQWTNIFDGIFYIKEMYPCSLIK